MKIYKNNIFSTMKKSAFGTVKKIMNTLFTSEEQHKYKLPKIICIGAESSGKSSILENITKCSLFPRDNTQCTKCPIHLIINGDDKQFSIMINGREQIFESEKGIYKRLSEYMCSLPEDKIFDDVITIKLMSERLPSMEFYDLPGLRAYPPEEAKISTDISAKYMRDENSIILCAVPAILTRLTSCQSIALIKELGLQHNSIIALTMCDRVDDDNAEGLIFDRILGRSKELIELKFAGYVGIINRTHKNKASLKEITQIESDWFEKHIEIFEDESDISEHDLQKIISHVKVSELIKRIDELYKDYIKREWVPKIQAKIKANIVDEQLKYKQLGDDITTEQLEDYVNLHAISFIKDYVDHNVHVDYEAHIGDRMDFYLCLDYIDRVCESHVEMVFCAKEHSSINYNLERFGNAKEQFIEDFREHAINVIQKNDKQLREDILSAYKFNRVFKLGKSMHDIAEEYLNILYFENLSGFEISFDVRALIETKHYINARSIIIDEISKLTNNIAKIEKVLQ